MKAPFFAGIFTLSSHHPYTIPEQYVNKFPKGVLPIHESIGYADYSIGKFFEAAKKTDWFDNTLFVITADHTQASISPEYNNAVGMYRVPIAYYCPKYLTDSIVNRITQQSDIYPTVVDLLGLESSIVSFGSSALQNKEGFSISYLNGMYQIIFEDYCLQFNGEKAIGFYNWSKDVTLSKNLIKSNESHLVAIKNKLEKKLKAYLQQYQSRVVTNRMTYDDQ